MDSANLEALLFTLLPNFEDLRPTPPATPLPNEETLFTLLHNLEDLQPTPPATLLANEDMSAEDLHFGIHTMEDTTIQQGQEPPTHKEDRQLKRKWTGPITCPVPEDLRPTPPATPLPNEETLFTLLHNLEDLQPTPPATLLANEETLFALLHNLEDLQPTPPATLLANEDMSAEDLHFGIHTMEDTTIQQGQEPPTHKEDRQLKRKWTGPITCPVPEDLRPTPPATPLPNEETLFTLLHNLEDLQPTPPATLLANEETLFALLHNLEDLRPTPPATPLPNEETLFTLLHNLEDLQPTPPATLLANEDMSAEDLNFGIHTMEDTTIQQGQEPPTHKEDRQLKRKWTGPITCPVPGCNENGCEIVEPPLFLIQIWMSLF